MKSHTPRFAALILAAVAFAGSLVLAIEHMGGLSLPGCGAGSPCAKLASGPWGRVPGLEWPLSYVGVAWFAGVFVALLASRDRRWLRWPIRLGAAGSLVLIGVMVVSGHVCAYCLMVHIANLLLLAASEKRGAPAPAEARHRVGLFAGVAAFGIVTASLGVIDAGRRSAAASKAQRELADTTNKLAQGPPPTAPDFTGRYRWGAKEAPIRIVLFTDYQCPDCRKIEGQIEEVLRTRADVSVSPKHFPFCAECNRFMTTSQHPNACWAARAAEAAGMLAGDEGFRRMHEWLFARAGAFTKADLDGALSGLGLEPAAFDKAMSSEEALARVKADIEEAVSLGIHYTPLIFVNNVEVRGWTAPDAIRKAVEAAAAGASVPASHPPTALEKFVADWREMSAQPMPPEGPGFGPAGARVRVVVWGDYEEPNTADVDIALRALAGSRGDTRYELRHMPVDAACNPYAPRTLHPHACEAALAIEATGLIGDADARARLHGWLMAQRGVLDDGFLSRAAGELSMDLGALRAAMSRPEVRAAIIRDAEHARRLNLRGIPFIFVNGKYVPRARLEGQDVLGRIVDEAAR